MDFAHEKLTYSVIGAFYEVYNALVATRQLLNYLRATNLDVGLLLHFGRSASVFRMIATPSKGQIEPMLESLLKEHSSGNSD